MTDSWQPVEKRTKQHAQPQVSIYAGGDGHLNAPADRALGQPSGVDMLVDPETMRIAIEPTDDPGAYVISREGHAGGDICLTSTLAKLGIDIDALSETVHPPVEFEGGRAIVDVSELPTGGQTDTDSPDTDGTDFWCGTCGAGPFESTTSVQGHHASLAHGGEVEWQTSPPEEADTTDDDDGDDSADIEAHTLSPSTVRDCAREVETLSELADLLDTSLGQARLLARDADVLTDLRDDAPRMGVTD